MTLYEFWRSMPRHERENFAQKCGYSFNYFNIQLIHARRTPKIASIRKIAEMSNGVLHFSELCDFFQNPTQK